MGILAKALAGPTAAAAKRTSVYEDVKDRIDGAILLVQLDEIETWLDGNDHLYPPGWRDAFDNMIELRREELKAEDVGLILLNKFDF